jgi:hypothetical protein
MMHSPTKDFSSTSCLSRLPSFMSSGQGSHFTHDYRYDFVGRYSLLGGRTEEISQICVVRTGAISSRAILGELHHRYARV